MTKPRVVFIVAIAANGVIGRDGDMPWKLSTDLKRFKALSMGKPLVMGRKTFESFGSKPLPGRPHIVISRQAGLELAGVEVVSSVEHAMARAEELAIALKSDEICVIGGGEIYRQAMPHADVLYVTHVEAELEGDTTFPSIDPAQFEMVSSEDVPAGPVDSYPTRYAIYRRRAA